jgi:hypothetical protein
VQLRIGHAEVRGDGEAECAYEANPVYVVSATTGYLPPLALEVYGVEVLRGGVEGGAVAEDRRGGARTRA